jgi:hypothetical protein
MYIFEDQDKEEFAIVTFVLKKLRGGGSAIY